MKEYEPKMSFDEAAALQHEQRGDEVEAVREQALKASGEAMPFESLFISFSFFLIVAALLLSGMLFVFGIEQRPWEESLTEMLGRWYSQKDA